MMVARGSSEASKPSAEVRYQQLVAQRRYIYHVLSVERWNAVLSGQRALRSRNELGALAENYALPVLVTLRGKVLLRPFFSANDAVPFYLTPRTPMFCRMIREGRMRREDVVAIGFDFELCQDKYEHWLFNSNPAYEGCELVGPWHERWRLDWGVLEAWDWVRDGLGIADQARWTFCRQAEALVVPPVSIADADHLVVDANSVISRSHNVGLKLIEIPGVFA